MLSNYGKKVSPLDIHSSKDGVGGGGGEDVDGFLGKYLQRCLLPEISRRSHEEPEENQGEQKETEG